MEDSKLQKLHETLKALAPKGKVGGLGFYAKAGHRSRRSAADGMPGGQAGLVLFCEGGDGQSGHTHFADEGDVEEKEKEEEDKAPPPSSDIVFFIIRGTRSRAITKKTKKRKEAAARLADIDAARRLGSGRESQEHRRGKGESWAGRRLKKKKKTRKPPPVKRRRSAQV